MKDVIGGYDATLLGNITFTPGIVGQAFNLTDGIQTDILLLQLFLFGCEKFPQEGH